MFSATPLGYFSLGCCLHLLVSECQRGYLEMENQNFLRCYICDGQFPLRVMSRIDGEANVRKVEIATNRINMNLPPLDVDDRTQLCISCNLSVLAEIQAAGDPHCLRLNVLTQTRNGSCLIYNAELNLHRLSDECRASAFISAKIFIPENVKSCEHHLDDRGYLPPPLLLGLRFIHRPYLLRGLELQSFLENLRHVARNLTRIIDKHSFTDKEFRSFFPITKEQF
ncbi:hypothetical protein FQA39_LY01682 [Lamprigera yunnana]|nr:hypothetical protein FQA39_LY01682 [Lamprigera yunnana]